MLARKRCSCCRNSSVGFNHPIRSKQSLFLVSNYAATCADTLSSELGILSQSRPRLVTAPWRIVPPGTNGGVTLYGLNAGFAGGLLIALTSTLLIPYCDSWTFTQKIRFTQAMAFAGLGGSILDSLLGAVLQASVVDVHSGKVVEGAGGKKVLVHSHPMHFKSTAQLRSKVGPGEGNEGIAKTSATDSGLEESTKVSSTMQKAGASGTGVADPQHESRKIAVGNDILDNNGVNLLMAALTSVGSMLVACWLWEVPINSILPL